MEPPPSPPPPSEIRYGENPAAGKIMPAPATQAVFCTSADGYRGIWWGQTPTHDEFVFKYSGGLGTYPAQQRPQAVFAPAVNKTFFVYGGTTPGNHLRESQRTWDFGPGELLQMISYFDHNTGEVPRPTVIFDKWTADPHDNPVLAIDGSGYLWVFSPSHSTWTTRSFIHRSERPYDISRFITIAEGLFAYPQPWWTEPTGFIFFQSRYGMANQGYGRMLYLQTSPDGVAWSEPRLLARAGQGHYQITGATRHKIASVFDYHPKGLGLEARTNLHYMESYDRGATWQTVEGRRVEIPVESTDTAARIKNYETEGLKVYLMDLVFDHEDRPVILYLTTRGYEPGPKNQPRRWHTARWTGTEWLFQPAMESDSNYDSGSLQIEGPDLWRLIGPTETGPQAYNPGGEIALWLSRDQGKTWTLDRQLTHASERNHTFVRRPLNAHEGFAAFWADGNPRAPSESRFYFTDKQGNSVWELPFEMKADRERPKPLDAPNLR